MPPKKLKTLDPVHPNAGVRAWYQAQLEKLVRDMANDMRWFLVNAWSDAPVTHAHDAKKPSIDLLRRALDKWGGLWVKRLESLSDKLAAEFANKNRTVTDTGIKASFKKAGLTIQFRPTARMLEAQRAVVAENVHLIKSIPTQFLARVQNDVWRTISSTGGDLKTLTDKLQESYGVTHNRAALIANDQNNKAKAVYEAARRTEVGIKRAVWMHSAGGVEPRPSHVALSGTEFEIAKGAYDKDEGEWIQPGELINCRCVSRPVVEGFD
jgi:uncharacterized protein with gpF-like domain